MAGAALDATALAVSLVLIAQASDPVFVFRVERESLRALFAQLLSDNLTRLPYTRRRSLWVDRCRAIIDQSGEGGER